MKKKVFLIYMAVNKINGKQYVGKTCQSLVARKGSHRRDSKRERYSHHKFYRAVKKYGWESFSWLVVFRGEVDRDTANSIERAFIVAFNTRANGYNLTDGGDGGATRGIGWKHSAATRRKMVEAQIGRNKGKSFEELHGVEAAKKIKDKASKKLKGRKFSPEHLEKLSRSQIGRKVSEKTKKLIGKKVKENHSRPEVKEKMSASQKLRKRKPHSAETRAKISKSLQGRKPGFGGRKHSDQSRAKMRAAQQERRTNESAH